MMNRKKYREQQVGYCKCPTHSYEHFKRTEMMTQEKNAKPHYFISEPYPYNVYLCEKCGWEYTDLPAVA